MKLRIAKRERRFKVRTDGATKRLIALAAAALGESASTFMLRAAEEKAQCILGNSDVTWMPADQFDELFATIDDPDEIPALRRAANRPRRYEDEAGDVPSVFKRMAGQPRPYRRLNE